MITDCIYDVISKCGQIKSFLYITVTSVVYYTDQIDCIVYVGFCCKHPIRLVFC